MQAKGIVSGATTVLRGYRRKRDRQRGERKQQKDSYGLDDSERGDSGQRRLRDRLRRPARHRTLPILRPSALRLPRPQTLVGRRLHARRAPARDHRHQHQLKLTLKLEILVNQLRHKLIKITVIKLTDNKRITLRESVRIFPSARLYFFTGFSGRISIRTDYG